MIKIIEIMNDKESLILQTKNEFIRLSNGQIGNLPENLSHFLKLCNISYNRTINWKRIGVFQQQDINTSILHCLNAMNNESLKSNKASNIEVVGEVSNAVDFINENNIMVVPLLAGSGMRIKIIEGMALGKLIIATTIAAEGVSYTDKENIVIANTPEEFTKAITYYLKNTDMQISIGKSARILMENAYDNRVIVNNLIAFFKQIN